MHHSERLLPNHRKTPGFLASGREEFNLGPETRLDDLELLCNKVLLKNKGIRRGQKEYPFASVSHEVIYSLISYYSESKECLEVYSHNLHFKITGLARRFFQRLSSSRIRCHYIILRNVEGKSVSFLPP